MNHAALTQLADLMSSLHVSQPAGLETLGFSMETFHSATEATYGDRSGHGCRTVACLAGWTVAAHDGRVHDNSAQVFDRATGILGLSVSTARALFLPTIGEDWVLPGPDPYDATPAQAARVVRHLAQTGEVDWQKMLDDPRGQND